MDQPSTLQLAGGLISGKYVAPGGEALTRRTNQIKALLSSRRLPEKGWDERSIRMLIDDLAAMDANNFLGQVGLGEREGRLACPLVINRHYGFAHGIGRSGSLTADQPKAAGSSLVCRLANLLVLDALVTAGLKSTTSALLLPMATGLALQQVFLALRDIRGPEAEYVVWPRVDQKTCFKCITSAGLKPLVVNLQCGSRHNRAGQDNHDDDDDNDELRVTPAGIEAAIERAGGASRVLCVFTTTSCFAPRAPDPVDKIARLCGTLGVPHVINNAYGVQSRQLCRAIDRSWTVGRVDAVVQSTDKNFMVPVGGAIVCSGGKGYVGQVDVVHKVSERFPGRASGSNHLDILMTLLWMGKQGWIERLEKREKMMGYLTQKLTLCAERLGERILKTPSNPISLGMTLASLVRPEEGEGGRDKGRRRGGDPVTMLGSMLFRRNVSGTRVVGRGGTINLGAECVFENYGAHIDERGIPYLTAAAALGLEEEEVDVFVERLEKTFRKLTRFERPAVPDS